VFIIISKVDAAAGHTLHKTQYPGTNTETIMEQGKKEPDAMETK